MSLTKPIVIAQCTEYSIKSFGGTEALVAALVRGLSPHFQIVLVSNDESDAIARSELSSFIRTHIPWRPGDASPAAGRDLARQFHEHDVDLAHFHFGGNYGWGNRVIGRSPIPFVTVRGVLCISTVHLVVSLLDGYCGVQKPLWFKLGLLPAAWLGKISALRNLKAEIAVSRHDERLLCRWYFPLKSRFRQIYHSRIREMPAATQVREKMILSVGHIAFRKGQHILARAFARIGRAFPDWKLVIMGPTGEELCLSDIKATIAENHLTDRVLLPGGCDDAIEWMQRAAVFVQPSFWEGLGLALQEALSCGCACIGMRAGGIPELIEHDSNGLLVGPGNVDELAAALERLIVDSTLRERFGVRARLSILEKGMTADKMVQAYEKIYADVLDRQP